MSERQRFVLEGEWTGYHSGQARVVHRTVERHDRFPSAIRYTDGTCLLLTVRPAKPRERVSEIHGYDSLIRECVAKGVDSVAALYAKPEPAPSRPLLDPGEGHERPTTGRVEQGVIVYGEPNGEKRG